MTYDSRVPLGQLGRYYSGNPGRVNSRAVPKAHIHDPRVIHRVPAIRRNADLVAQWNLKAAWARYGMTSVHEWRQMGGASDSRYPLQQQNSAHSVLVGGGLVNVVFLLIPRNKYRFGFSITNFTLPGYPIFWSYGAPIVLENGVIGGHQLAAGASHFDTNTNPNIDGIYVFTRTVNVVPSYVIGYEATIAPEANIK